MTHHRLAAGLYQLVRIILNEDEVGCSVFEYDKPSSLFGQFDDEQISADARGLDVALEAHASAQRILKRHVAAPVVVSRRAL